MFIRLSLYTLLLCLVPFFTWIFQWQWQGVEALNSFDHFLYWVAETGSSPYAIITCGLFALLFLPVIPNRKQWMLAVGVMAFSVVLTQGLKSVLKTTFAEPRPYVVALAQSSDISTDYFYDIPRNERKEVVLQFYAGKPETPVWLARHHGNETGYSFPSGHTIFAVGWLLLTVGFTRIFGSKSFKVRLLVGGMTVWAVLMLVSRLRLGTHYPIDLLVSTLISWLIHYALFLFLQKKAIFLKVQD